LEFNASLSFFENWISKVFITREKVPYINLGEIMKKKSEMTVIFLIDYLH